SVSARNARQTHASDVGTRDRCSGGQPFLASPPIDQRLRSDPAGAVANGVPRGLEGYRDIVNVPVHGQVKVVIPFTDPVIVGRIVYHCHLLSHEDKGMMAKAAREGAFEEGPADSGGASARSGWRRSP